MIFFPESEKLPIDNGWNDYGWNNHYGGGLSNYGRLRVGYAGVRTHSSGYSAASAQSFGNSYAPVQAFPQSGTAFTIARPRPIEPNVTPKEIEIRKTFPETWLFDSFDFDSE